MIEADERKETLAASLERIEGIRWTPLFTVEVEATGSGSVKFNRGE
jgi:hypothetical protein